MKTPSLEASRMIKFRPPAVSETGGRGKGRPRMCKQSVLSPVAGDEWSTGRKEKDMTHFMGYTCLPYGQ